jgi:hypothetical protein
MTANSFTDILVDEIINISAPPLGICGGRYIDSTKLIRVAFTFSNRFYLLKIIVSLYINKTLYISRPTIKKELMFDTTFDPP